MHIQKNRRSFLKLSLAGALMAASFFPLGLSAAQAAQGSAGRKIIIVYYSWGGNTRAMAELVRERTGGDIVELQTVDPYPEAYRPTTEQARRELDSGYLPPLRTKVDIAAYDTVIIGSPNWWGTQSMPVRAFLSEYDLSGKTLLQFITHEGSGLGRSMDDLRKFCPNSTILPGLAVRGGRVASAGPAIDEWLMETGILG